MTWVMCNLVSVFWGTMLVSVQGRCTVCAKRTIGSEIILGAPGDTPRYEGQLEVCFCLSRDSANLDAR